MSPGQHDGVERDGADVLLHLPHPGRLGLDAVDGQDPAGPDVGDPVVVLAPGGEGGGHQGGVEVGAVRELLTGQVILSRQLGRHSHNGLVAGQAVPLRVPPVEADVVRVSDIGRIDPVQLQSSLVIGPVPVDLSQAVDGQENLELRFIHSIHCTFAGISSPGGEEWRKPD